MARLILEYRWFVGFCVAISNLLFVWVFVMKKFLSVLLPVVALCASTASVAADVAAGEAKSATCTSCHGAGGNSLVPTFPSLAGQSARYIASQLQAFKDGKRKNATMQPMAAPLTTEDMENLGAYYESQTAKVSEITAKQAIAGEKVYRAGNAEAGVPSCTGCHSPNGAGIPAAGYPALSGQHAVYVKAQLKAFQEGTRKSKVMEGVVAHMSAKDVDAVSTYISALH